MFIKQLIASRLLISILVTMCLLGLLYRALIGYNPNEPPSPLIGMGLPKMDLPNVFPTGKPLTNQVLSEQVVLLNIWATWCEACQFEHQTLLSLSKRYPIPLYGINYKDDPRAAQHFLYEKGNPYTIVARDQSGDAAIDLGISVLPETFIIAGGKIVYRYIGIITPHSWQKTIYPEVLKWQKRVHV